MDNKQLGLQLGKRNKTLYDTPKTIVSFDGGAINTGVAMVSNLSKKGGFEKANVSVFTIKHKDNTTQGYEMLESLISNPDVDFVIYEDFRLYPSRKKKDGKGELKNATHFKTFSRFEEVMVIGIIKFLCMKYSKPSFRQSASEVKNKKFTNIKYTGTYSTHALDALHHVSVHFRGYKYQGKSIKF